MKRKEFLVLSPAGDLRVYADELKITNTGTALFAQIRDGQFLLPNGEISNEKEMETVLVLTAGNFTSIVRVNGEALLYKETGVIQTLNG